MIARLAKRVAERDREPFPSHHHLSHGRVLMLNLNNLRNLLAQIISPSLQIAVLFTPEGQLVSYAASAHITKDEVRVVVGLGGELWQESREEGLGQLDSEVPLFHFRVLWSDLVTVMTSSASWGTFLLYPSKSLHLKRQRVSLRKMTTL